jgi:hypothetical protein
MIQNVEYEHISANGKIKVLKIKIKSKTPIYQKVIFIILLSLFFYPLFTDFYRHNIDADVFIYKLVSSVMFTIYGFAAYCLLEYENRILLPTGRSYMGDKINKQIFQYWQTDWQMAKRTGNNDNRQEK